MAQNAVISHPSSSIIDQGVPYMSHEHTPQINNELNIDVTKQRIIHKKPPFTQTASRSADPYQQQQNRSQRDLVCNIIYNKLIYISL